MAVGVNLHGVRDGDVSGKFRSFSFRDETDSFSGTDTALPGEAAAVGRQLQFGVFGGVAILRDQPVLAVRAPGVKLVLSGRKAIGAAVGGYVRCG